jgi:hypothetical protein
MTFNHNPAPVRFDRAVTWEMLGTILSVLPPEARLPPDILSGWLAEDVFDSEDRKSVV